MPKDTYYTIKAQTTGELKVLGSRFIGNAFPVSEKDEAGSHIRTISRAYHDATHNPYAYKLVSDGNEIIRSSDDKEPQGTAGKPILMAIEKHELSNVVVIVTRYFGGKKLGKGGLARAYRDCADITLDSAQKIQHQLYKKLSLRFPYDKTGLVMKIVTDCSGKIVDKVSEEKFSLIVNIPLSNVERFNEKINFLKAKNEIQVRL